MAQSKFSTFQEHGEYSVAPKNSPQLNSEIRHLVVISGEKPAGLEVWYRITAKARNGECAYRGTGQFLSGSPRERPSVYDQVRVPADVTRYTVNLPIDRYVPGACDWQAYSLDESTFVKGQSDGPAGWESLNLFAASGWRDLESMLECRPIFDSYRKVDVTSCRYDRKTPPGMELSRDKAELKLDYIFMPRE